MSDTIYEPGDLVLYRVLGDNTSDYRPAVVISHYCFSECYGLVIRWADNLKEWDVWPVFPEEFVRVEVESHE